MKKIATLPYASLILILIYTYTLFGHPADPSPLLANYALFGEEFLNFTEEAETQSAGWTGTNGYLEQSSSWCKFNNPMKIKGVFDAGTNNATTYSDTVYIKSTTKGDLSLLGGKLVSGATFPDPVLPDYKAIDINVNSGNDLIIDGSQALAPGQYGTILLNDDDAEIVLESGLYEIDSLIIRGTVRVKEGQKGATRILVKSFLHFDNAGPDGHRLVADGDALGKVLLYSAGDVILDQSTRFDAALVAPYADLQLMTEMIVNGQIHAKSITFRNGFNGQNGKFIPFNPGNLIFPDYLLEGVPEDSLDQPKTDNSYLLSFPLLLSNASEYTGTVDYEVRNSSSTGTAATMGEDFENNTLGAISRGTLHFAKGDSISRDSIHIWIIDDEKHEPIEQIEVQLTKPDSVTFENGDSSISYFIPILSEDPEYNEMDGIASAFDTLGDGTANLIRIDLSEELLQSAVTEVAYSWPSSAKESTVALSTLHFLNNKQIAFPIASNSGEGSGSGTITLDDGTVVSFAIVDSVGPVLKRGSATVLSTHSADTLHLTVSEPITNFDNNIIPQIILFTDSAKSVGDTVSLQEVTNSAGNDYSVVLKKGSLALGMWAQFNTYAAVADLKGNHPASYNQKIQLQITVDKVPGFRAGALFDADGPNGRLNGLADSAYITITLAPDTARITMADLTELVLDPAGLNKKLTWQVVNDSLITININELDSITTKSAIRLHFSTVTVSGELRDSVAPVITKANYESWDSGDTLRVSYSEPIGNSGNRTPFHFFSGTTLSLQEVQVVDREATYLVTGGELTKGDSIWIRADGDIADRELIFQLSDNNQRVPLTILTVLRLQSAAFLDDRDKPDGYIDGISLQFDGSVPPNALKALQKTLRLPLERNLTFSNAPHSLNKGLVYFPLDQSTETEQNTAVSTNDFLLFDHTVYSGDTALYLQDRLQITDSMGPVAIAAHYSFGQFDTDNPQVDFLVDTLRVTYSESVAIPFSDTPFGFIHGNEYYTFAIIEGFDTSNTVSYARIFREGNRLPVLEDSLFLRSQQLNDEVSILQLRDTKPVPLTLGAYTQPYSFTLYPNPIKLDINRQFTNEYLFFNGSDKSENHLAVIVRPLGIRPVEDTLAATITILDPVGNEIIEEDIFSDTRNNSGDWFFAIEPKNRNNRTLGRGSYSIQVILSNDDSLIHYDVIGVQESIQ